MFTNKFRRVVKVLNLKKCTSAFSSPISYLTEASMCIYIRLFIVKGQKKMF